MLLLKRVSLQKVVGWFRCRSKGNEDIYLKSHPLHWKDPISIYLKALCWGSVFTSLEIRTVRHVGLTVELYFVPYFFEEMSVLWTSRTLSVCLSLNILIIPYLFRHSCTVNCKFWIFNLTCMLFYGRTCEHLFDRYVLYGRTDPFLFCCDSFDILLLSII